MTKLPPTTRVSVHESSGWVPDSCTISGCGNETKSGTLVSFLDTPSGVPHFYGIIPLCEEHKQCAIEWLTRREKVGRRAGDRQDTKEE